MEVWGGKYKGNLAEIAQRGACDNVPYVGCPEQCSVCLEPIFSHAADGRKAVVVHPTTDVRVNLLLGTFTIQALVPLQYIRPTQFTLDAIEAVRKSRYEEMIDAFELRTAEDWQTARKYPNIRVNKLEEEANKNIPIEIWQDMQYKDVQPRSGIFYYNTETKTTVWEKPKELMGAAEKMAKVTLTQIKATKESVQNIKAEMAETDNVGKELKEEAKKQRAVALDRMKVDVELAKNWTVQKDTGGNKYWKHVETGEISKEKPRDCMSAWEKEKKDKAAKEKAEAEESAEIAVLLQGRMAKQRMMSKMKKIKAGQKGKEAQKRARKKRKEAEEAEKERKKQELLAKRRRDRATPGEADDSEEEEDDDNEDDCKE